MTRLAFTDDEFQRILKQAQAYYASIGMVKCPYFQDTVQFNAQGFEHLRRKTWNRGRSRNDQFMRLKFVEIAPEILRLARTLQGVWHGHERIRRHKHGKWEEVFKPATFYEFIAVIKERRFKVIVKETDGQAKQFWSLIPFWRQTEQGKRVLHSGDPLVD